jgi:hypothetical protein
MIKSTPGIVAPITRNARSQPSPQASKASPTQDGSKPEAQGDQEVHPYVCLPVPGTGGLLTTAEANVKDIYIGQEHNVTAAIRRHDFNLVLPSPAGAIQP